MASTQQDVDRRARGLGASATLAINLRCKELASQGKEVFGFGFGQSPFPVPVEIVDALREHAGQKDYLPMQGLPELCASVAAHHQRHDGLDVQAGNVVIGPGSKELMYLLQLVYDADVLLPSPAWVSYAAQARLAGRTVQAIPTTFENRWQLSANALADACQGEHRRRLLILNSPGNPDGLSYGASELQAIAAVARQHGVVVLSDEIYGLLHHRGEHVSIARYYPEGTIVSSGLSKWCGAGGWRLGSFAFPDALAAVQHAVMAVGSETFSSVCAPVQYAAISAYDGSETIGQYVHNSRRILRGLCRRITSVLQQGNVRVHQGDGGFYLFPDFGAYREPLARRGVATVEQLGETLLNEAGVALLPGSCFGRPSSELTARLAYVCFDGARALQQAQTFSSTQELPDEFFELCCADVLRGVERMLGWFASL